MSRIRAELLQPLEADLCRIHGVSYAKIHLDENQQLRNVDLVANRGRHAKSIVRDAEIVFRRREVDVDHKKIGVAQLSDPSVVMRPQEPPVAAEPVAAPSAPNQPPAAPEPSATRQPAPEQKPSVTQSEPPRRRPAPMVEDRVGPEPQRRLDEDDDEAVPAVLELVPESERVRLVAVHSTTRNGALSVEVELGLGLYEGLPGLAEGPADDPSSAVSLVAGATLQAVRNLLQPHYEALVRETRLLDAGGVPLVVVVVDFGAGRQVQRLVGASLQRGSLYDTAVYATLDAINRPLGRARFRKLAAFEDQTDDMTDEADAASA